LWDPHPAGGHPTHVWGVIGRKRDFNVEVIDREAQDAQIPDCVTDGGPQAFRFKRFMKVRHDR